MECIVCASRDSANLYRLHRPCSVNYGLPCDSCQEMINLRAQIEVAQEVVSQAVQTLGKLLDQQREIASRMNRVHDRTILRFPPEISSAIFQFAAPPQDDDTAIVPNLEGYVDQLQQAMSATLSLASVCREWRQLVCSTPQLWTSLQVHLQPSRVSDSYLNYVTSWINRSGALPLSIYIYTNQDENCEYLCQAAEYLINILNSCSGRWKSLTLRLPFSILRRLSGNADSGSILRSLKLISANHGTNEGVGFGIANLGARPAYVYLSAISSRAVSLNWGNVTQVELDDLSVDDILELLRIAPRLLICTVSYVDDPAVPTATDITAHQSLRELNIIGPVLDDVGSFFNRLNLPYLEKLSLDMDDGAIPYSSLLTMFSRSSPPLKEFIVTNTELDYDEIIDLCETLPYLERLDLHNRLESAHYQGSFLVVLAETCLTCDVEGETDPEELNFLPNLKYLRYDVVDEEFDWSLVPAVFGDLSDLDNPRRRPLKSLYMQYEADDNDDGAPYTPLDQEDIPSLLAVVDAGIDLKIVLREGEHDLIEALRQGTELHNERAQVVE